MHLQTDSDGTGIDLQMLYAGTNYERIAMKPGDFGIGSEQSRAAARMAVEERQQGMTRFELWVGHFEAREPSASPWSEDQERMQRTRTVGYPGGMTLVEVAQAVGGYSQEELTIFAEKYPNPLSGCGLLRLDR
jgi:hypothetical protein